MRAFTSGDVPRSSWIDDRRLFTEFVYGRLHSKMDAGFARIDGRFAQVGDWFARLERKLDQFIDTQSKTNELVEQRLRRWAPPDAGPGAQDKE